MEKKDMGTAGKPFPVFKSDGMLVVSVIMVLLIGMVLYMQSVQNLMLYTAEGTRLSYAEDFLGEPDFDYTREGWEGRGGGLLLRFRTLATCCYFFCRQPIKSLNDLQTIPRLAAHRQNYSFCPPAPLGLLDIYCFAQAEPHWFAFTGFFLTLFV